MDRDESVMPDEYHKGVQRLTDVFPVLLTVEQTSEEPGMCSSVWNSLHIVRLW